MPHVQGSPLVYALRGAEDLGAAIAHAAHAELGGVEEREFERGEHKARPLTPPRARDVAIVHRVHGEPVGASANDRLVRLWFFAAAVRDAGARSVTLVTPYLPYSRKDRRTKHDDPVNSRYVAQHCEATGADRVVAIEPHDVAAFENAFRIEALALPFAPLLARWLVARVDRDVPLVLVSPDVGGTKRVQQLRDLLAERHARPTGLAFVEKRRSRDVVSGGLLVGDVRDADCVVVDDLASSGGTLLRAAQALRAAGARSCTVAVAHALLLPSGIDALVAGAVDRVLATDSVPVAPEVAARIGLEVLPLAPLLGAVLDRAWRGGPLADLTGIGD